MSDPIETILEELDVEYELVACDTDLADTAAFCDAYGYELADSANTIIVVGKGAVPVFAACVVLANARLDVNGVVRKRLGPPHTPATCRGRVSPRGHRSHSA